MLALSAQAIKVFRCAWFWFYFFNHFSYCLWLPTKWMFFVRKELSWIKAILYCPASSTLYFEECSPRDESGCFICSNLARIFSWVGLSNFLKCLSQFFLNSSFHGSSFNSSPCTLTRPFARSNTFHLFASFPVLLS